MARVTVLTEEHFHSSHLNVRERLLLKLYAEFKQKVAEISFRPLCRATTEISKHGDCAQPGSMFQGETNIAQGPRLRADGSWLHPKG